MVGKSRFDVVYASDLHVMGGTNAALVSHVNDLAELGYRVGLIPLHLPHALGDKPLYLKVRALVNAGRATIIDARTTAVDCDTFIIDNPSLMLVARKDLPAVRITARRKVIIVPFPAQNGLGRTYDPVLVQLNAAHLCLGPYVWAPVSPLIREQLAETYPFLTLSQTDAGPIVDAHSYLWRDRTFSSPLVVGRHSRPQPEKWPQDRKAFLAAYPLGPDLRLDFLGISPAELERIIGPLPEGLTTVGYNAEAVHSYLDRIDLFCYFHHPDWVEALGIVIVEAMLSGVPCILPGYMQVNFGDNAFYAEPSEAAALCRSLLDRPEELRAMAIRARSFAETRFGAPNFHRFLSEIALPPPRSAGAVPHYESIFVARFDGLGLGPTQLLEEATLLAHDQTVAIAPTGDRISTFVRQTIDAVGIALLSDGPATCGNCIVLSPFSDDTANRLHQIRADRFLLRPRGDESGKAGRRDVLRMAMLSAPVVWQVMDRAAQVALERFDPNAQIEEFAPLETLSQESCAYLARRRPVRRSGVTGIFMPSEMSAPLLQAISEAKLCVSFFGKAPNFKLRYEVSGQNQDLLSWIARVDRLIVAAGAGMGRAETDFLQLVANACAIPFVPVRLMADTPWPGILREKWT